MRCVLGVPKKATDGRPHIVVGPATVVIGSMGFNLTTRRE